MSPEAKNLIFHPNSVMAICTTVLMIALFITNRDAELAQQIVELQINQKVVYDTLDTIKNNDLVHFDIKLDELLNSVHNLEIALAKLDK